MKTILFITGRLPFPLDDGWKIRTYHLIKGMVNSGYKVDLLSYVSEDEDSKAIEAMRNICNSVFAVIRAKHYSVADLLKGLVTSIPFSVYNYHTCQMAKAVVEIIKDNNYDFVQIEDIVMCQYLDGIVGSCSNIILDMHNIESALLERYAFESKNYLKKNYAYLTANKLNKYEIEYGSKCSKVLVCSQEDSDILATRGLRGKIEVIPNGVDTNYFQPMLEGNDNSIVFVGSMDYHANVSGVLHFAENVFPQIRIKNPGIRWYIVGKKPTAEVLGLASDSIIVTGSVPDVRPFVAAASVVVAPLLVGGGTRLKILEAMSMGKPIVSTSIGAEGIEVSSGENIILADNDKDFADSVNELLRDRQKAEQLGKNANRQVLKGYAWNSISGRLAKMYETLLADCF